MKKIYFSFLFIAGALQISNAQLSLTKAFNEPVLGDMVIRQLYDSTTVIPKSTGAGQTWNFNTMTVNSYTESSNYVSPASTPSISYFPGTTLSEDQGGGGYTHYKSAASNFEVTGLMFPGTPINFTNTAVLRTWPVGFGYSVTDPFSGGSTSTVTTSMAGTVTVSGSGTGTVVLPGAITLTNCLQLKQSVNFTLAIGTSTQSNVQTEYTYFHSSNKFPAVTVNYQAQTTGTVVSKSVQVFINKALLAGIKSPQLNNDFSVFPNPAHEAITIALNNNPNLPVSATLTNMLGQIVITENLGYSSLIRNNINISALSKGLYFMNVKVGEAITIKKIVIE